jgi:Tfp pilus assembly protein PilP
LVVGVPFAGQSGAGLETLVGQCVHTLPVRCKLEGGEPFVSLLKSATEARARQGKQPATGGISGFLVSELVLKGIMQSRGDHVALVSGPDAKTYLVRVNDRLLDGTVRAITADTLVCLQDVNDPLSLTKQREVRMTLRAVAEAK